MKRKQLSCIIMSLILVCVISILSGCAKSENGNSKSENQNSGTEMEDKKSGDEKSEKGNIKSQDEKAGDYNLIEKDNIIFLNEKPVIKETEDYYEIQNVLVTKQVDYTYDYSMFENKKVGDTVKLPNGEFLITEISEIASETHINVENDHFSQYFIIAENKSVSAVGLGEHIQIESVYEGNIRLSKDCTYNIVSYENYEYTESAVSEFLESKKEEDPWMYGVLIIVGELDDKNYITEMSDLFIL